MENEVNVLLENGSINEIICGNDFAYIVNDNNDFLSTEYKVLQSQGEGLFVKCMKLLYNGKIQLYYLTNGYKTLMSIIPLIDSKKFMSIVTNLLSAVIDVKNNGFLSCQNIDIATEHIFIDPFTYKVSLVYLPIGKRIFNDISAFENELRTNLIKIINDFPSLTSNETMQLITDLTDGMFTIENICLKIKKTTISERKVTSGVLRDAVSVNGSMKLIAMNTPVPFEILITKNDFIIGRKQELVDGVVSFSRMIGRSHCKIISKDNQFAVIDLNSANGTYVNKVRLQPGQPCQVRNGDMLRLANVEFQVNIG